MMPEQKLQNIFTELRSDPAYTDFSDEQLWKKAKEIESDGNLQVILIDERLNLDITIQKEALILLTGKPGLFYLYSTLLLIADLRWFEKRNQKELAKIVGLSFPTFQKYRDGLLDLQLIRLEKKEDWRQEQIKFNSIERLKEIKVVTGKKYQEEYLKKLQQEIRPLTPDIMQQIQKISEEKQTQLHIEGMAEKKAKEIIQKKEVAKKKEEQRFPQEDYRVVLNAYKKYKQVGLQGYEELRAKGAIKKMFLSQRSVKQIVDFIKFCGEHDRDENYRWLWNWTLETVGKKMPEFLAGKLKIHTWEDNIPEI